MGSKEVHRMHAREEKEFQRMREKKVDSWQGQLSHAKLLCALPVTVRVQAALESVGAEFLNSPIEESSYWGEEIPGWSGLPGSSDC